MSQREQLCRCRQLSVKPKCQQKCSRYVADRVRRRGGKVKGVGWLVEERGESMVRRDQRALMIVELKSYTLTNSLRPKCRPPETLTILASNQKIWFDILHSTTKRGGLFTILLGLIILRAHSFPTVSLADPISSSDALLLSVGWI